MILAQNNTFTVVIIVTVSHNRATKLKTRYKRTMTTTLNKLGR